MNKTKGQSRMDNPGTLATLCTQDTGRRQKNPQNEQHGPTRKRPCT